MKKFLMLMFVASVVSLTSFAKGDDAKKGEFKFEKETHDFGKIKKGVPVTYIFNFTNVGDEPIIIWQAKASCGCTEPSYSQEPVKKGTKGEVKVTFNAAAVGPFTKNVTIQSNAKTSTKVLYIKGEVLGE